ncbi:hypothetical protein KY334_02035 [Candidatus Woesearchaeota archaeon]|nr:hypothetical protein [Candidatus Woesearchaeota archaeon]
MNFKFVNTQNMYFGEYLVELNNNYKFEFPNCLIRQIYKNLKDAEGLYFTKDSKNKYLVLSENPSNYLDMFEFSRFNKKKELIVPKRFQENINIGQAYIIGGLDRIFLTNQLTDNNSEDVLDEILAIQSN